MHTSAGLAKKYGLEQYLNQPAELNSLIFNLMLLQETIQLEQARKDRRDNPHAAFLSAKRIAHGKFVAGCRGDEKYRYAVESALKASTDILAVFNRNRFVKMLQSMGVPEDRVNEFCSTVTIDDDTHCINQEQ